MINDRRKSLIAELDVAEEIPTGQTEIFMERESKLLNRLREGEELYTTEAVFGSLIRDKDQEAENDKKSESEDEKKKETLVLIRRIFDDEVDLETSGSRALINFLIERGKLVIDPEALEALFDRLSDPEIPDEAKGEGPAEAVMDVLSVFCSRVFRDQGMTDKRYDFRKMILTPDRAAICSFAAAFHLSPELTDALLNKVLHEAGLSYYTNNKVNKDYHEAILALALRSFSILSPYETYKELEKFYTNLPGQPADKEPDTSVLVMAQKRLLARMDGHLFSGSECTEETIDPGVRSHLVYLKSLKWDRTSTIERRYRALLKEVKEAYEEPLTRYWEAEKQAADTPLQAMRKAGSVILDLTYRTDRRITLKKGRRFMTKGKDPLFFILQEDAVLDPPDVRGCVVKVSAMTGKGEAEKKYLLSEKQGPEAVIRALKKEMKLKFLGNGIAEEVAFTVPCFDKDGTRILCRAQPEEKMRRFRSRPDNGRIRIFCPLGTRIRKGTVFQYTTPAGMILSYRVEEDCGTDLLESVTVGLADTSHYESLLSTKDEVTITPSKTITEMEERPAVILEITNRKKVCLISASPITEKKTGKTETGSDDDGNHIMGMSNFHRFFFDNQDYVRKDREETPPEEASDPEIQDEFYEISSKINRDWMLKTEITSNLDQQFSARSHSQKRDVILTLVFLKYVKSIKSKELSYQKRLSYFDDEADRELETCRSQPLYMGNPYDRFLKALLLFNNPDDTFMAIWAKLQEMRKRHV